ncbi:MAG: helix-turn-helix domain-containing protein [Candidatus Brocadiaceae bacterium]|nr:helix-turn-helix domain-containing protein [Candidatus Brocadiaceae bacterium]
MWYTTTQTANLIGIDRKTLMRYLKQGLIKGYRIGGWTKFKEQDIQEYLNQNRINNTCSGFGKTKNQTRETIMWAI